MYNQKLIGLILLSFFTSIIYAQETDADTVEVGWKNQAVGTLNLTQNKFDNWTQGGENSWSWQLDFRGGSTYRHDDFSWENSGKLVYGRIKVGDSESQKAADEIKLESLLAYNLSQHYKPYISFIGNGLLKCSTQS